jgi:hypothetical protein
MSSRVSSGRERSIPAFHLPRAQRFDRVRCDSSAAARSRNREDRLLREDESGIRQPRLRSPRTEIRSRQTMLRRVRLWPGRHRRSGHGIRLPAGRRRKFRCLPFVRAHPLATTSCSAAARLIRPITSARSAFAGRGCKETQQEDSNEIFLNDHSGPGAGRHSERDFELG